MAILHSVEEIVLPSGMRGIIVDVPNSTVMVARFYFRAGNDYVSDRSLEQTAHIMEHLSFGQNNIYPSAEAFSREFTKHGAYSNAHTMERGMLYEAESALLEWDRILDLMRIAICEPLYTQELLDLEKGNVREELISLADDHARTLWQKMDKEMGEMTLSDKEKIKTIAAVKISDIEGHHKKTHTINNMRFAIGGDLSAHREEIVSMLSKWDLPRGEQLEAIQMKRHSAGPVHLYHKELSNVIFRISISLNRTFDDQEMVTMEIINNILNGTFHSRMWGKARSLGICYSMDSDTITDISGYTTWDFFGAVSVENIETLFELISVQLSEIAHEAIIESELQESKDFKLGSYQMKGQTVDDLVNWYSGDYYDYGTIDNINDISTYINAVSLLGIYTLVNEFLNEGHWSIGGIGSFEKEQIIRLNDLLAKVLRLG